MRFFVASLITVSTLAAATLLPSLAAAVAAEAQTTQTQAIALPASAGGDSSALTGEGVNTRGWPIDRPIPGGVMRKDPGSSAWHFVRALSNAELKEAHAKYLAEMVALHGDEPRDIMIEVKDSLDIARLKSLGIAAPASLPATVSTRLLYRQIPELHRSELLYWGKGNPRPVRNSIRDVDGKPREALSDAGPIGRFTPSPAPSAVAAPLSIQTVTIWSEGFEINSVPGTYWSAGDLNTTTGADYWGDISTSCSAQVHGGSWSIGCNGYGSYPSCTQYVNDEDAYAQNASYLNLSGYSTYDASFYVKYQTEAGYDYFWWAYSVGGGWIQMGGTYSGTGGWTQLGVTISNASHTADNFAFQFNFFSDYVNTSVGAYVDDLLLRGDPFVANLASYAPPGWSGPIVPSSVTGTTTTGTLYTGQPTYIDWAVQNNGAAAAGNFYVYYYLDAGYIGSDYVSNLPNGSYWSRSDWSYTVATSGSHTLKMVIDATSTVAESNEADNTYQQTFTWNTPPPPDLIVQSVVASSTAPAVGSTIFATVTVRNQGTGLANGTFYADFYKNVASAPTQGQFPYDDRHTTFSLAAGATETYTVLGLTSSVAATWKLGAYVDGSNAIANESSEANNSYWPVNVTWTAANLTVSGTLAYDDTSYYSPPPRTNNRPMRCVKVELWDSEAGHGTSDWLVATTTTNSAGQFTFPAVVNQDTHYDQGLLDVYVKAYFESQPSCLGNLAVRVVDGTLATWTYASPTYVNITNGALGTLKPLDYARRSALHLYDTALRGYDWSVAKGYSPAHPWMLKLKWQSGLTSPTQYVWQDTVETVNGVYSTVLNDLGPDEWDDGTTLHEYGHHLAHLFAFDDPSAGGKHGPQWQDSCNAMPCGQLAWSEGVAHYLACATQSPPTDTRVNVSITSNWATRHTYAMDVETGDVTFDAVELSPCPCNDEGWTWETPIAGTLCDIDDSHDDSQHGGGCGDSLSLGPTPIWNVLASHTGTNLYTINDFYQLFCQRNASDPVVARKLSHLFCEHGMQTSGCGGILSIDGEGGGPRTLMLAIGPNPVHSGTAVSFDLPSAATGRVSVRVYDVGGRLLQTLFDGAAEAGRHSVRWDATEATGMPVRSGMYFCKLVTAAGSRTASVLVLR